MAHGYDQDMAQRGIPAAAAATGPTSADALFSPPGAAALTRLSAVETVRARILLSIEHGLLPTGSRLPKLATIAEGLEVSQISARRALESLVVDGVLVRRRGRGGGTFVADAPPRLEDTSVGAYRADERAIRRLIDQRLLMECALNYESALVATPEQCDELESLLVESESAENWLEHHGPDSRFHRLSVEISGRPEAATYLVTYEALLKYFVPYPMHELETSWREHRALIDAFRRHDGAAAIAITRTHVSALHREMFVALPR
ncbi:transcriptional regulator [Pseudoclavibacter endophyticus]|nr:transcriptional regulator [Pseudoclavibacter endophyticus]